MTTEWLGGYTDQDLRDLAVAILTEQRRRRDHHCLVVSRRAAS